jgi:hypothetical protein
VTQTDWMPIMMASRARSLPVVAEGAETESLTALTSPPTEKHRGNLRRIARIPTTSMRTTTAKPVRS